MTNYYKKSEKAFKEFVKKKAQCTKEEWDEYAQDNCLFSANTLMFHVDAKSFEDLKKKYK